MFSWRRVLARRIYNAIATKLDVKEPIQVDQEKALTLKIRHSFNKTRNKSYQLAVKSEVAADFFPDESYLETFKTLTSRDLFKKDQSTDEYIPMQGTECLEGKRSSDFTLHIKLKPEEYVKHILWTVKEQNSEYGYQNHFKYYVPKKKVAVEFSSPNIAKPFHMGHLRSTIHGDCISRMYERHGWDVVRINFFGDWGAQIGVLLHGFSKYGNEQQLQDNPLEHLLQIYVQCNEEMEKEIQNVKDKNESVTFRRSRAEFRKLEEGDEECMRLWSRFKELTEDTYIDTYKRFNIEFTEYDWESKYSDKSMVIQRLQEKNLLQTDPETGAKFVTVTVDGKERQVKIVKSDGSTLYITRDIAAAIQRSERLQFDKMHYVVENGQHTHFENLLEMLKLLDIPFAQNITNADDFHVKFGRVQGMSSRKGQGAGLAMIISEAQNMMLQKIVFAETTKDKLHQYTNADILAMCGLKTAELSYARESNYRFDWTNWMKTTNSIGIYISYTYARLCSLSEKYGKVKSISEFKQPKIAFHHLMGDKEMHLVQEIARYEEVVEEATYSLEANVILTYILSLCKAINGALKEIRVIDQHEDIAMSRMFLFHCSKQVLENAMLLIGLTPLKKI